ncbi:MAG TPA: PrsW family intramembrane metalloprotease [Vicinamibacterales bacterium]|nr:PrsW family intramembrane metalloprotease [Vicinamibacterales bacterium]HPK72648.1 PrsW family intramembrane metalloprotease [Vicinamibacterales bacterium]
MPCARPLVGLGVLAAVMLALTAASVGGAAFVAAAAVALLPLPLYLAVALWLDRFEPEPRALLAVAFLWGASAAVVGAGLANGVMEDAIGAVLTSILTAPLVEEALKGAVLAWLFLRRRDEFDGAVDGVIYAAMVGLGFAFAENVDYYGRAFQKGGAGGLAVLFTLRGVLAPFSHPLFTSLTGLGLGVARQSRSRAVSIAAPAAGFAGAVLLHAVWNAGASAGLVFFGVYALVMLPALAALFASVGFALRFEGRILQAHLAPEAAAGLIGAGDYALLCSVRGRLHALTTALQRGGVADWRRRRAYHRAASELAFLRRRAAIDGVRPDPAAEAAYLQALEAGGRPAGGPAGAGG